MSNHITCYAPLAMAGIAQEDAIALRRISMALHNWHELECGAAHGAIEREGPNGEGKPRWRYLDGRAGGYIADREAGALKRLAKIMARYPGFAYYVQGDPRGCALYILRPGDVPEGATIASCYNRGIAVCK
jgi:hypothetical protein